MNILAKLHQTLICLGIVNAFGFSIVGLLIQLSDGNKGDGTAFIVCSLYGWGILIGYLLLIQWIKWLLK